MCAFEAEVPGGSSDTARNYSLGIVLVSSALIHGEQGLHGLRLIPRWFVAFKFISGQTLIRVWILMTSPCLVFHLI